MRWSEAELLRLERAWSTNEDLVLVAAELHRSYRAVEQKAHRQHFGRREGATLAELERRLGYCRRTIRRAAAKLGFKCQRRRNGKQDRSWWALTDAQVEMLVQVLRNVRTVQR